MEVSSLDLEISFCGCRKSFRLSRSCGSYGNALIYNSVLAHAIFALSKVITDNLLHGV